MSRGFFGKIADRLTLVALRGVLREVRSLRTTLEIGIDSYRVVNGLAPAFAPLPEINGPSETEVRRGSVIRPGDFQTVWMIEELCREHHIPLLLETDLEALAIERGWIDGNGQMLMRPAAMVGQEIG